MLFKTTMNNYVKVKLTEHGIMILKMRYAELTQDSAFFDEDDIEGFELNLDEDGYYRVQLWELMHQFGKNMCTGCAEVFDINDVIIEGQPTT